MKILWLGLILLSFSSLTYGQALPIKKRKATAILKDEFLKTILDTSLNLADRENLILKEIKKGNIPNFLKKLTRIEHDLTVDGKKHKITFYTLPDYLSIGNDDAFIYMPMTPILAQKVATLLDCSLPTKKMVDLIYAEATIKLAPAPIAPTKAMTTVPIFEIHNTIVQQQLAPYIQLHHEGGLTAGNKKDVIISNKIYTEKTPKVVIYGWHQLSGKAIQPVYNKHTNTWADYSHGIRLIQNKVLINGNKTTLQKILLDPKLHLLLSDEGIIAKPNYPITNY
ncbi:hypothetical protein [Pedobacter insulae]|uniref:Uncharacterized protein n=1 Tax=Pedobacter insulae TaxID=414048 RepID=A0A1I2WNU8_9SPHI|nr:hypothetical protein [Pedobacter insulae]SFH02945.1 hypothetical protein SAMN04489864_104187 [Pedobacter insulae]